jgi:hypothetical protein
LGNGCLTRVVPHQRAQENVGINTQHS